MVLKLCVLSEEKAEYIHVLVFSFFFHEKSYNCSSSNLLFAI